MWRSLQWRAKEAKYDSASEDESIPDATEALVGSKRPHPWGGPSEGDDRDYDFLKRGEECRELYPGKVEFREALQRKLQHHAVHNPAEHGWATVQSMLCKSCIVRATPRAGNWLGSLGLQLTKFPPMSALGPALSTNH